MLSETYLRKLLEAKLHKLDMFYSTDINIANDLSFVPLWSRKILFLVVFSVIVPDLISNRINN